jgi:hypothetical protein
MEIEHISDVFHTVGHIRLEKKKKLLETGIWLLGGHLRYIYPRVGNGHRWDGN